MAHPQARTRFLSCPGLTGASRLDPRVKPGGDRKTDRSVKSLWARYQSATGGRSSKSVVIVIMASAVEIRIALEAVSIATS